MPTPSFTTPQPARIKEIFTRITPRYDFLNSLLSLRLDRSWRRWAVELVLEGSEKTVLDIGTGTGKFLKTFLEKGNFDGACGVDLCQSMLERARKDLADSRIRWIQADVSKGIPAADASFDLVSAAFTLRSIPNMASFFAEIHRILRPSGKVAFLELTRPVHAWLRILYYPYLRFYLPLMGTLISGSFQAYSFLSNSILHFEEPATVARLLRETGFSQPTIHSYTGGIATLIVARKV